MTTPERSSISPSYRWNTRHLYRGDRVWARERDQLVQSINTLGDAKGKLKQGKRVVVACLEQMFEVHRRLDRLASYAHRRHDEDTRVVTYQALRDAVEKLQTRYAEATSFVEPELVALPAKTLMRWREDSDFEPYDRFLWHVLRTKAHILSRKEEALLAKLSLIRDSGSNAYEAFTSADLTFPEIHDERGRSIRLTQALFARYRTCADRELRKRAFEAFFGTFAKYANTLASLLSAQVNANIVHARARRYRSALEASLDADELPVAVYESMVSAVNQHLPLLHRYLRLRRRLMGLRQLGYHDLYRPMVDGARLKYPYDGARDLLLEALQPLGPRYLRVLKAALTPGSGWVDVYPNKGKRSGAYMDGSAYDVHPFVLGNYLDDYNSLSMLAHEMGHAMHSYYSNNHQPYPKATYSIFVAEVASTLNEVLLAERLIGQQRSAKKQLSLLGEQLEGFRLTLFRQALFAEFELEIYRMAEAGEALTADALSQTYLRIARRYYGHDQGLVRIDELYGCEWGYIPHLYYNFYVFQYVTGMTAAVALAEQIRERGEPARKRYFEHLLQAGDSDAPIALLRRAGVDLTTNQPYAVAMSVFERTLARAEQLAHRASR